MIDALAVLALSAIGLAGFESAFGGLGFFVVGIIGAVAAITVAHVCGRERLPGLVTLVLAVAVLFVVGAAAATREEAIGGFVPTLGSITGFVDGLISGWRRLLTTLPPSGSLGNLLAIPFFSAYATAFVTYALARRSASRSLLIVAPGALVIVSILLGTREPVSVLIQGTCATIVAVGWLSQRDARRRVSYIGSNGARRIVGAIAMLAIVAVAGTVLGPRLPLVASDQRTVLRDRTEPPFDPRAFGSPLNGFQKYLVGDLEKEVLFTVVGLPAPLAGDQFTYVRLAVMDDYDGVVWRVSPRSGTQGGRFLRVGESVPTDVDGDATAISVTINALNGAWLPSVGTVSGVSWSGDEGRASDLRGAFRLSTVTSTGIVPSGLVEGDTYDLRVVQTPALNRSAVADAGIDTQVVVDVSSAVPEEIASVANVRTKGKATVLEQIEALEQFLKNGYYASGEVKEGDEPNAPGHSYARIIDFLADDQPVGNAEQYAAAFALMARSLDIPARVVMGFRVQPGSTEVTGADVHAWVEVGFENGWYRVDPMSERREKPKIANKRPKPVFESQDVPPPPVIPPEPEVNTRQGQTSKAKEQPKDDPLDRKAAGANMLVVVSSLVVGVPTLGIVVFASAVALVKRRRRRRRRMANLPANRLAGGWAEYVDTARDAGLPVPPKATRREIALLVGGEAGEPLAQTADAAVFGAGDPSDETITAYWTRVDDGRKEILRRLSIIGRVRALFSTTSLRGAR